MPAILTDDLRAEPCCTLDFISNIPKTARFKNGSSVLRRKVSADMPVRSFQRKGTAIAGCLITGGHCIKSYDCFIPMSQFYYKNPIDTYTKKIVYLENINLSERNMAMTISIFTINMITVQQQGGFVQTSPGLYCRTPISV